MEHGGFVFFKEGDKIAEVIGVAKEMEDDGTLGNHSSLITNHNKNAVKNIRDFDRTFFICN